MEAIASNLGIVVSDVKGNRELAQCTNYSTLFPYDHEKAMAVQILNMLENTDKPLGGYELMEKEYSIKSSQKIILPYYEKILSITNENTIYT